MLSDVVGLLRCPHCHTGFTLSECSLRCSEGHVFDVARQGYVNLLPGGADTKTADTSAMVEARDAFLGKGHYSLVVQGVAAAAELGLAEGPEGCIVDVGAGTGHYLAAVLDRVPQRVGLALDISKFALRRAARAHDGIGAVVCDIWRPLPVLTDSAAAVIDVFAPRNPDEIQRVLKPGGVLIVATPSQAHLREIISALDLLSVDPCKQQRLDETFGSHFALVKRTLMEGTIALDHADVGALAGMGPSAWHIEPAVLQRRITELKDPTSVTISVTISVYRCA